MNHKPDFELAFEATTHCLTGCGLGEVSGIVIGTIFGFTYFASLVLGVVAGLVFGYLLGIIPLLRSGITLTHSTKIILTTEALSFIVMEAGEVLTELHFPGMRKAGIKTLTYWLGLFSALIVGFIAAYPINYFLLKRGVRHHH